MHIANSDKPVAFYNLNVIISVGYRVKCPARHPVSHLGNLSLKGLSGTWLYFESEASCRKRDGWGAADATDIFGNEQSDGLAEIIGAMQQTFDGQDLYPSVEEKEELDTVLN